jgi:hypothetical protein
LKATMSDDGAGQYPGLWLAPVLITKENICDLINNISPPGYITVKEVYPDNPTHVPSRTAVRQTEPVARSRPHWRGSCAATFAALPLQCILLL